MDFEKKKVFECVCYRLILKKRKRSKSRIVKKEEKKLAFRKIFNTTNINQWLLMECFK